MSRRAQQRASTWHPPVPEQKGMKSRCAGPGDSWLGVAKPAIKVTQKETGKVPSGYGLLLCSEVWCRPSSVNDMKHHLTGLDHFVTVPRIRK